MILWLSTAQLYSQDAPKAAKFSNWAGFPAGFDLYAEEIKRGDYTKWGNPKWIYSYRNKERTLIGYVVAVYHPGTLWADKRTDFVKAIRDQVEKGKSLGEEFQKNVHIDKDSNGRDVYFTILGFGPGGTLLGGVTFQPEYDLVVTQMFDHEDDTPDDQRLKGPVSPSATLPQILSQVLEHLARDK